MSSFILNLFFERRVHFYTKFVCVKDEAYLKLKNVVILKLLFMLWFFSYKKTPKL